MRALRLLLAVLVISPAVCRSADQPEGVTVELPPIVHELYWHEFTLRAAAPESDDGRFELKQVHRNGEVELIYTATPKDKKLIVVKPMPKKFKDGTEPPTVGVKAFDSANQVATIRELRMK